MRFLSKAFFTAVPLQAEGWGGEAALPGLRGATESEAGHCPNPEHPRSPAKLLFAWLHVATRLSSEKGNTCNSKQEQSLETPARAAMAMRLLSSLCQHCDGPS